MKKIWKLSKVKASALAKREFGTSKGLVQEPNMPAGFFWMKMGNLVLRIRPWEDGCIIVTISRVLDYNHINAIFDGNTLREEYVLEEKYQAELEADRLLVWVSRRGTNDCHQEIEKCRQALEE